MVEHTTHYQSAKPHYGDKPTWNSAEDIPHLVTQPNYPRETYIVVDIETTAQPPQRPLLITAYDKWNGKLWVAHEELQTNNNLTREDIQPVVVSEFEQLGVEVTEFEYIPHCGTTVMQKLLDECKAFNQQQRNNSQHTRQGLLAHNTLFDLGVAGTHDDQIIDYSVDPADTDGVISYSDYSIRHRRAGAKGRIYDVRHRLQPTDIPVADTLTVADALHLPTGLEKLAEYFDVDYTDTENETHGEVTLDYIKYNANDVAASVKITQHLQQYLEDYFSIHTDHLPLSKIYSSASVAKHKLKEMGYDRTHYTEQAAELCMKAYYGGQTEALYPGSYIQNVDYTDFLSQYPTASALTGVWSFMQAQQVHLEQIDVNDLPEFSLEDFRDQQAWENAANYYVVVDADNMKLPVRAKLSDTDTTRVYKADVTHQQHGVVYHYLDYVAAELHGQGTAEVKAAFEAVQEGKQDLDSTEIGGTEINGDSNVMKRGIEERKRVQYNVNGGEKDERTKALKVVSNSLYGVSAERIVEKQYEGTEVVDRHDKAGTYLNPHVASTITAAGRLMLSIGEIVAQQEGSPMYYCDTDSLVVDEDTSSTVTQWFSDLNPYDGPAGDQEFLEVEHSNVDLFTVGVKKYVLVKDGDVVETKEHGLGHFKQFQGTEGSKLVVDYWGELLSVLADVDVNRGLSKQDLEQKLYWQTQASTYIVRHRLSELLGKEVRYGDFLSRSVRLSRDGQYQYLGMGEQSPWLEINRSTGSIETVSSLSQADVKQVKHLLVEWQQNAVSNKQGRPSVNVVDTAEVTKEASDLKQAWDTDLLRTLSSGMSWLEP